MEWGVVFAVFTVLGLLFLVLWIWALVDCLQVPNDSMYQTGTKLIWVLVIVLGSWIGAIIYLVVGRPSGPGRGTGPGRTTRTPSSNAWGQGAPAMPPPPPGTTDQP